MQAFAWGNCRTRDGYEAAFAIALDLSDTAVGADDSFQMPGGTPPTGTPPTATPSA